MLVRLVAHKLSMLRKEALLALGRAPECLQDLLLYDIVMRKKLLEIVGLLSDLPKSLLLEVFLLLQSLLIEL